MLASACAVVLTGCGISPLDSARGRLEDRVAEFDDYVLDLVESDAVTALGRPERDRQYVIRTRSEGADYVWDVIFTARGEASLGGADAVSLRACVETRVTVKDGKATDIGHADIPCPPEYEHLNRFGGYDRTVLLFD